MGQVHWVTGANLFLIDLVDSLFQPAPSKVDIVEKAWVLSCLFAGFYKSFLGSNIL